MTKVKLAFLSVLLVALASCANASTTVVTATITDPNGQIFANGTFKAEWYGDPQAIVTGLGLFNMGPIVGILDGSGTFVVTLTDTHSVAPAGGKWRFTICANASVPCFSSIQDVSGATLNLSSQISADANAISVTGNSLPKAYSSAEISNPGPGTSYFDTTLLTPQFFNGAVWASMTGGAGGGAPLGGNNTWTGTNTFNAAVSTLSLNKTTNCNPAYSTDVGLILADARNRLPANGGVIDCKSLTGAWTLSTVFSQSVGSIFIDWGVIQLSLCQPSASAFSWQANNFAMRGIKGQTVFTNCAAGKNVLSSNFTLNSTLQGLSMEGITLVGGSGTSGVTALLGTDDAITVGNSTHAVSNINIRNLEVSGFGLNAVHMTNANNAYIDIDSHNNSEGVRMCGVSNSKIYGKYHDANLINSVFTVVVGFDAFSVCGLNNSNVTVQAQWQNWLDAEAIMIHNCLNCTIIAPQMDNVSFGIGIDNSTINDTSIVTITNPNINGSTTATAFPTNPAPANDCIFAGGPGAGTVDITIIGGVLRNCNKVNQGDFAGGIVVDNADKVDVQGVIVADSVGCAFCYASGPSTRANFKNDSAYNMSVSVANPGGGAVFPVGPVGGFADGVEVASAAAGSSGRIEGLTLDHVKNGLELIGNSPLLLIGRNDYLNITGSNIVNPGNATFLIQAPSFTSSSTNPALTGFTRAASTDQYCWRNNANTTDICLSKNTSDQLLFNGAAIGGGLSNPMTTVGDIIVGGTAGAPTRLGQGTNGTFLGVSGGTVGYYTPGGGSGTVTSVATGLGLTGGPITAAGTVSMATTLGYTPYPTGSSSGLALTAANTPQIQGFYIPTAITFSQIAIRVTTADATNTYDWGTYDVNGNILCNVGTQTIGATGNKIGTCTQGTITIPPGKYYFGWTGNATTGVIAIASSGSCMMPVTHTAGSATTGGVLNATITPPADAPTTTGTCYEFVLD